MKRFLFATLLLAFPLTARAGVGLTAYQGTEISTGNLYVSPFWLPTLDIVSKGRVIQLNALDLLSGLSTKNVWLGGRLYITQNKDKVSKHIKGVLQLGGRLEVVTDTSFKDVNFAAAGTVRMGAQSFDGAGFGIYVVPELGFADASNELEMFVGGGVQISAWMR